MVADDLTLTSNSKIDLARLCRALEMCFLTYTKLIIALPFFKQADEPFTEAPHLYYDKQGLLTIQNNLLEPIWLVEPILPSALVHIVAEVEFTTQRLRPRPTTDKNLRPKTDFSRTDPLKAKNRNGRDRAYAPKTIF